jgi:hypothetical protein
MPALPSVPRAFARRSFPVARPRRLLLAGAALLVLHALTALSGLVDVPDWVPIAEALVASVIGLSLLRDGDAAAAHERGASPWSTGRTSSGPLQGRSDADLADERPITES